MQPSSEVASAGVLSIGDGRVELWHARTAGVSAPELLRLSRELISPEELERYERIAIERRRHEFLMTRVLCRLGLSRYADVPPDRWVFRPGEFGRPEIHEPRWARGLRFNLSNTDGLVACVVALERNVGVDVECLVRSDCPEALGTRWFAAAEAQDLERLPPRQRRTRFLEYWTLKEAYAKARGMGLKLPLDHAAFQLDGGDAITASFGPAIDDTPSEWDFRLLRPTPEHVMAVAMDRGGSRNLELVERCFAPEPSMRWRPLGLAANRVEDRA